MSLTFRDFLNTSTSPVFSFADMAQAFNQQPSSDGPGIHTPPTVVHGSFAEAHGAVRSTHVARGWNTGSIIGGKFSFARSHIAYAMGPKIKLKRTPQGLMPVEGAQRVCVLHATKGWRVHHRIAA
jgi:hypothetical protein